MIYNAQHSIDGTAVQIITADIGYRTCHLTCVGNTTVYVGGTNAVTSSTGYGVAKSASDHDIAIGPGDELYAICANGQTEVLTVLITRGVM